MILMTPTKTPSSAIYQLLVDDCYEPGYPSLICTIIAQAFDDGLSALSSKPGLRRWRRLYHLARDFRGIDDWAIANHLTPATIRQGFELAGIPTTIESWRKLLRRR